MQISLQQIDSSAPTSDIVEISLFGPGVGECIVMHIGDGKWFIIDSCLCSETNEPIALKYLRKLNVDIENDVVGFLITHWHEDHTAGALQIIKACANSKIYIPYSLTEKETITFALLHKDDQISNTAKTIKEFRAILEYLKSLPTQKRITRIKQEHSFFNDPINAKRMISLSPSDIAVNRANEAMANILPSNGTQRTVPAKPSPNHNAVAIVFSFGNFSVLLGSDLEVTSDNGAGWSAIFEDNILDRQSIEKCQVYKIAHHGSMTAHTSLIWEKLLTKNPTVIGTCFSRSKLPKPTDIQRVLEHTTNFFVSSETKPGKKPRRDNMVEKEMDVVCKSRKVIRKTMGHVQIRATNKEIISIAGSENVEHHSELSA